jgi:protease-4
MNAMLDETYDAFVSNVSAARKIPMKKMPDIAKGRVFTGEQALKMGLVDELGGMQEALTAIKKHLKLAETDEVSLRLYPETETPSSLVMKMLQKGGLSSALLPREFETLLPLWNEVQNEGAVRAAMPAFFLKAGW